MGRCICCERHVGTQATVFFRFFESHFGRLRIFDFMRQIDLGSVILELHVLFSHLKGVAIQYSAIGRNLLLCSILRDIRIYILGKDTTYTNSVLSSLTNLLNLILSL